MAYGPVTAGATRPAAAYNPLQERISAYEKRIEELEKDLAVKGEEIGSLKTEITTITEALDKERRRLDNTATGLGKLLLSPFGGFLQ